MSDTAPRDFIRQIIHEDLESGKHDEIVTRFPPEPNGYLHVGHVMSICLNFGVGQETDGRTFLRFDDTNPGKEREEYVRAIEHDVKATDTGAYSSAILGDGLLVIRAWPGKAPPRWPAVSGSALRPTGRRCTP